MAAHLELELRDYQRGTIAALDAAWEGARRPSSRPGRTGPVNRPVAVLPTGVGKTVIFSRLGARAHAAGGRALFLVHRDELADQTAEKLRMSAPGAWVGVVKAERDEHQADLVVASVQTLARASRRDRIGQRGLMLGVADEAHHAASPTWMTTMAHFGAFREADHPGRVPWAGFTATLSREDHRGLGDVWEEVAYSKPIGWFVERGYLVPPVGRRIQVEDLNLRKVRASRGDLQANDLGDALMDAGAPRQAAQAVLEHAKDRRTAAFWPTVAVAEQFVAECLELGITAELVVGTTPKAERLEIYERFRTGETSVVSTAMVLTEGWDAPWCDCILIGRPTQSKGLFIQMVGRGLRPWRPGGKVDCLVLDLMGASERNGLATLADLSLTTETESREPRDLNEDDEAEPMEGPDELWVPDGPLRATEVDLFAGSDSLWLQTEDRGWWFIPTDGAIYFLYPQDRSNPGFFALGRARTGQVRNVERLEKDMSLDYAMAWAERYAAEEDTPFRTLSRRSASWRRSNTPATKAQIGQATFYGIPAEVATTATKRELSDMINVKVATRVLSKIN